ncbi:hypothetical protein N826_31075 [Skermanella aerolata KACC 11604]|nr:hypothetical protein N826_31075 [Skermanella aerolata KACC 11604]
MSVPPLPDLDALSLDELKKLVVQLLVEVTALREENRQLRAENARLKDLPKKPKLAPGGMDKATKPDKRVRTKEARRQRRKRQSGRRTPPVTEERTLVVEAPAGSRRRGFEPFTVQDLILTPQVIRFRRERWVTPEGQEIVAPLPPEVSGHFGPGIVRYVPMQHVQGQVTVERLLAQLKGLGVCISKGQIITILTASFADLVEGAAEAMSRIEILEAAHRPVASLYAPVILFDHVVFILTGAVIDVRAEFVGDGPGIAGVSVGGDPLWLDRIS